MQAPLPRTQVHRMPQVSAAPPDAVLSRPLPALPTIDPTALLDTAGAAAVLGMKPGTLAEWRTIGRGPRHIRVSAKCIRYRRSDIDAWLEAQARTHTRDVGSAANATAPGTKARWRGVGRTAA